MSITLQEVILNNKILWLVADPGEREGALCSSPEDFEHGHQSHAHLFENGDIMRLFVKIGDFKDLKFTGVHREVSPASDAFANPSDWSF